MPTYEYECEKCGNKFEAFQQMIDKPLSKCPSCGSKPKRLISAGAGFIFKGSGFYATDYRKKPKAEMPPCANANNPSCASCPKAQG